MRDHFGDEVLLRQQGDWEDVLGQLEKLEAEIYAGA